MPLWCVNFVILMLSVFANFFMDLRTISLNKISKTALLSVSAEARRGTCLQSSRHQKSFLPLDDDNWWIWMAFGFSRCPSQRFHNSEKKKKTSHSASVQSLDLIVVSDFYCKNLEENVLASWALATGFCFNMLTLPINELFMSKNPSTYLLGWIFQWLSVVTWLFSLTKNCSLHSLIEIPSTNSGSAYGNLHRIKLTVHTAFNYL